jgi:hypothetical protein
MRATLGSFVRDLVPSCDPVGVWPSYDDDERSAVVLGDEIIVVPDHDGERLRSWRSQPTRA